MLADLQSLIIFQILDLDRRESFARNEHFVFRVFKVLNISFSINLTFILGQEEEGEVSVKGGCQQQQHGNISVKQRHPSSPMAASPPVQDHFDQQPQFKSRTSPYFQPAHHPPGPEGTSSSFFANQFYPFQTGFSGHKMASDPISRFVSLFMSFSAMGMPRCNSR